MDKPDGLWEQWVHALEAHAPVEWERLPAIDLYMDQVLTFMNRQFEPFTQEGDRVLTASMINNYVKDDVLPRPNKKKYGREHLAKLFMICTLKGVLSLPEIDALLRALTKEADTATAYTAFVQVYNETIAAMSHDLAQAAIDNPHDWMQMAMQLSLSASACRMAAARILASMAPPDADGKDKEKET